MPHFAHGLPGGALQNFLTHPLSLALPYLGGCLEVAAVQRRLVAGFGSNDELRAVLAGPRASGTITVSGHSRPPHLVLRVRGTEGWLEADVPGELWGGAALAGRKLAGRHDAYEGLGTLIDAFYRAVIGDAAPPVAVCEMDDVNTALHAVLHNGMTA